MPKKLKRCLRKVKGKVRNPHAVCVKSTGQKPHRKRSKKR